MPWNMSNPLYRWKKAHGKLNKSVKSKVVKGKIMSRRRRVSRAARRYSPRRYYRRFRRGKAPLPILPILGGVVAPMMDSFERAGGMDDLKSDPVKFGKGFIDQIAQHYTGYSVFPDVSGVTGLNTQYLFNTYGGLLAGVVGHMLANKFGINRYMKKVPLIGKYVQL